MLSEKVSKGLLDVNSNVPRKSGIYFLFDKRDNLVYLGKSKNLRNRLWYHIRQYAITCVKPFKYSKFILMPEDIMNIYERGLIDALNPKYNDCCFLSSNEYLDLVIKKNRRGIGDIYSIRRDELLDKEGLYASGVKRRICTNTGTSDNKQDGDTK